jgi:hypothetical protein
MTASRVAILATIAVLFGSAVLTSPRAAVAQSAGATPRLRAGTGGDALRVDGRVDEPEWARADSIEMVQVEPREGGVPECRTVVRVLATGDAIVIGVRADDPDAGHLVSFSRQRDASLATEDHVTIVLDGFGDGRSGYVFAVNPDGARYDALVTNEGQSENPDWDAIWEAATARTASGWSAEIRIPD